MTKPVAPEVDTIVDLDELESRIDRADRKGGVGITRDEGRALIAETRAHRAAKLPPVGVVAREHRELAWRARYPWAGAVMPLWAEGWASGDEILAAGNLELETIALAIAKAESRGAAAKPPAGVEVGEAWIPIGERLPDSDLWVVCVNHEGDYQVVQLEFTDDSEGHSEPYWAAEGGDVALCNYPFWMPLPNPPEAT